MRLRVSNVKKFKSSSKNGFTDPSKAVLPLWIIFGYTYFVFSLQPYSQLGRTGLLARLYNICNNRFLPGRKTKKIFCIMVNGN